MVWRCVLSSSLPLFSFFCCYWVTGGGGGVENGGVDSDGVGGRGRVGARSFENRVLWCILRDMASISAVKTLTNACLIFVINQETTVSLMCNFFFTNNSLNWSLSIIAWHGS